MAWLRSPIHNSGVLNEFLTLFFEILNLFLLLTNSSTIIGAIFRGDAALEPFFGLLYIEKFDRTPGLDGYELASPITGS